MLFVSDSFELTKDKVIVLTAFYPQTKLTNTGNTPVNLLKSKDGINWVNLTSLTPKQTTSLTLDSSFIYITFKEDSTVYFQSEYPNHQHNPTGSNNSTSNHVDTTALMTEITNLLETKADKDTTEAEIASLNYAINQYNNDFTQGYDALENKLGNIIGLTKANTLTTKQKESFISTMGLLSIKSFNTYMDSLGLTQKFMDIETRIANLSNNSPSTNITPEMLQRIMRVVHNAEKQLDSDSDGLSDYDEYERYGTNPFNNDTDGDTFDDGYEVQQGTNPKDSNDKPEFNPNDLVIEATRLYDYYGSRLVIKATTPQGTVVDLNRIDGIQVYYNTTSTDFYRINDSHQYDGYQEIDLSFNGDRYYDQGDTGTLIVIVGSNRHEFEATKVVESYNREYTLTKVN